MWETLKVEKEQNKTLKYANIKMKCFILKKMIFLFSYQHKEEKRNKEKEDGNCA